MTDEEFADEFYNRGKVRDPEWLAACEESLTTQQFFLILRPMLEYIVLKLDKIEAELESIKKELK